MADIPIQDTIQDSQVSVIPETQQDEDHLSHEIATIKSQSNPPLPNPHSPLPNPHSPLPTPPPTTTTTTAPTPQPPN